MEERIGKRINQERMDEAASTEADTVGVACPYCLIMLDDGARARGDEIQVLDLNTGRGTRLKLPKIDSQASADLIEGGLATLARRWQASTGTLVVYKNPFE